MNEQQTRQKKNIRSLKKIAEKRRGRLARARCEFLLTILGSLLVYKLLAPKPPRLRTLADESNSAMEKIENTRPKIYTFFQRIETTKRDTGMTDADDDSLLDLWVKAWNEAGFDAKIMDLSDAKQHPRYNEYSQLLKDVPMENNGGINRPYNEMCFYRWLAMASVVSTSPEEIVWMADYDVFPLTTLQHNNQEPLIKPNFGGAFTVYSINVPCLMSGSAPEWERMAFKILQNGIEHHDVESQMWTDMFALMDLGDTNSDVNHEIMPVYHSQNSVISASNVLLGRDWKVEDCTDVVIVPKDTVAVHFSHHAMKTGLGGSAERVGERPTIIRDFISMKKNVCGGLENVKP